MKEDKTIYQKISLNNEEIVIPIKLDKEKIEDNKIIDLEDTITLNIKTGEVSKNAGSNNWIFKILC